MDFDIMQHLCWAFLSDDGEIVAALYMHDDNLVMNVYQPVQFEAGVHTPVLLGPLAAPIAEIADIAIEV